MPFEVDDLECKVKHNSVFTFPLGINDTERRHQPEAVAKVAAGTLAGPWQYYRKPGEAFPRSW